MITAIEHKIGSYIEGIFSSKEKAEKYFSTLKRKEDFITIETHLNYYPIYILEGLPNNRYTYTDNQQEVISWIEFFNNIRKEKNTIYFNIYY